MTRLAVVLLIVVAVAACGPRAGLERYPASGLRTREVGAGSRPVVLLHGYGSAPEEWLPFTATIALPAGWRFVFPEAPAASGFGRGRGWWRLDLDSHRGSDGLPDLSRVRPPGLAEAATRVRTLLREVSGRHGSAPGDTILGGFSQGGMVSAEIAFRSDQPLKALVLLSPTTVDAESWRAGFAARRQLPVFLSHGRSDTVLPFAASERLGADLRRAGLDVTWVPFDGDHDIPPSVVDTLNRFLRVVGR
jgi:phospholipase/carboxylesterase